MSPSYCTRCRRPLPAASAGGICPDCLPTATVSLPSRPTPPGPGNDTASGGLRVSDLPLPRHMLPTQSGSGGADSPAPDRTPEQPGQRLPAAPPGLRALIRHLASHRLVSRGNEPPPIEAGNDSDRRGRGCDARGASPHAQGATPDGR